MSISEKVNMIPHIYWEQYADFIILIKNENVILWNLEKTRVDEVWMDEVPSAERNILNWRQNSG